MRKYTLSLLSIILFSWMIPYHHAAAEPIKLAAIFAETGEAAQDQYDSIIGAKLAVEEINRTGNVLDRKLSLILFDNYSTAIGSKIAAERAVKEKVVAIIGSSWSAHSFAAAQVAQANKIPMISNVSTHPDVTKSGDYIFRACFTDPFQGKALVQFVRNDLKARTAVILTNVSSDYSMGLASEIYTNFSILGGKILFEKRFVKNTSEEKYLKILKEVKQASPDILFIPAHDSSGFIVKLAQGIGMTAPVVGGDGWDSNAFLNKGGNKVKLGYYSTHWSEEINTKASREFIKKCKKYYPDYITPAAALSYDAVYIMVNAIRNAKSLEPEKIRMALSKTTNYKGVTGTITLNETGDPVKSVVIMRIINGKPNYLKTIEPN